MLFAPPPDLILTATPTPSIVAVNDAAATVLEADRTLLVGLRRGLFELWARRSTNGAVSVTQQLGAKHLALDLRGTSFQRGLPGLVRILVRRPDGTIARRALADVCPNDRDARPLPGHHPQRAQRYPYDCGHTNSRAVVWGLDEGWAVPVAVDLSGLPAGRYLLEASLVAERVVQARGGDRMRVQIHVRERADRPRPPRPPTPAVGAHGGGGLPDLVPLPPDGLEIARDADGRDRLRFGSNIWNAGTGPALVVGRRSSAESGRTMPAVQLVGGRRRPAGRLVYDPRDGHLHWHFDRLARYRLQRADGRPVRISSKVGFCFGSTDAIDLSLPQAPWRPARSADRCAARRPEARTVSMDIQVGWGDQYDQRLPGQAFDITDLPNGDYRLEIVVDPAGRLLQASRANDRASRWLSLGGRPGARTVSTDDGPLDAQRPARSFSCHLPSPRLGTAESGD